MEWLEDAQLWPGRCISMLGENKMRCLYKPRPNRGGIFVSYKSWELSKNLSTSLVNQIGKRSSSFGIFVKGNDPKRANESSVCKKKHRRCWSQELHRLFVDAIEQLGGAQVAKPKQIKEVMRVRGLTNTEIKSHLQKYRLHIQ
ncbi:hypothetical protein Leryth_007038 [Lithospermum erythrorhizon]|nr:hypothetical protein Leryth_007038 [Lithospermum erythrorhizon]